MNEWDSGERCFSERNIVQTGKGPKERLETLRCLTLLTLRQRTSSSLDRTSRPHPVQDPCAEEQPQTTKRGQQDPTTGASRLCGCLRLAPKVLQTRGSTATSGHEAPSSRQRDSQGPAHWPDSELPTESGGIFLNVFIEPG